MFTTTFAWTPTPDAPAPTTPERGYRIPAPPVLTPAQKISRAIIARKAAGATTQEAIDAVLGESAYAALVDSLYHELRGEVSND